jgi:hypothetical protein
VKRTIKALAVLAGGSVDSVSTRHVKRLTHGVSPDGPVHEDDHGRIGLEDQY